MEKNINIKCPPNTGSEFYNYKGTYSIILLAIVDAEYNFQYVNIGANGMNRSNNISIITGN